MRAIHSAGERKECGMKDPYWTYIDKLRGQIDELKAGVDFYEEVVRLRAEKIDLVEALEDADQEIMRLLDGMAVRA